MEETEQSGARVPRFAADRMLQRLARWLRLMGADVLLNAALSGAEMLQLARTQGRPLITRDKRLRTAPDVLYIESQMLRAQIREVMARYPFDPRRFAFTRCSVCNEPLREVPREALLRRVPPFVYAAQRSFAVCERCGRIHWNASHVERALRELDALAPPSTS